MQRLVRLRVEGQPSKSLLNAPVSWSISAYKEVIEGAYGNGDVARELIALGLQYKVKQSRQGHLVFGHGIEEVVLGLRGLGVCGEIL